MCALLLERCCKKSIIIIDFDDFGKKSIKKQRLGGVWSPASPPPLLAERRTKEGEDGEEDEEEESEEDETGVFDPLGETENSGSALLMTCGKRAQRPVTERITDEEEEEGEEKKKREAEAEESPDVFIAYEKHATKSQQHRERLKRQAEASANAYRPGLRNRGEDGDYEYDGPVKAMTFRGAEWLKMNQCRRPLLGKRSKDGHRRPAVILESIISKIIRIKTESRFKQLARLIRGINVARWGLKVSRTRKLGLRKSITI